MRVVCGTARCGQTTAVVCASRSRLAPQRQVVVLAVHAVAGVVTGTRQRLSQPAFLPKRESPNSNAAITTTTAGMISPLGPMTANPPAIPIV